MTNHPLLSYVNWIQGEQEDLVALLETWTNINTSSFNLEGLQKQTTLLKEAFSKLGGHVEEIALPPCEQIDSKGKWRQKPLGKALSIIKHPEAPIQVFLGGHMDTVFAPESAFQKTQKIDQNILQGPGVADMKGGLIILLKALEALEKSPFAGKIGWHVLINPDEEIGSPGSAPLIRQFSKNKQLGLLFEPAFSDGSIVSARKGSANFTVIAKGKSAHAGRDFAAGRNAIVGLARLICELDELNDLDQKVTLNIGKVEGGEAVNVVPDTALCRFNMRASLPEEFVLVKETIHNILSTLNANKEITLTLYQHGERTPKMFDEKHQALFKNLQQTAQAMGVALTWKASGGICDGNILAEEGIPSIDTLGAVGGNIHTHEEYILINSLVQRAQLTALFLMQLESLFKGKL
ncbi:putative uncharacterized protein [Parachlamydia acanthamoebae UV-7]|uniref:Peptidase M20 dimerisation domain-containing protein n=1 Tax=Parachlamydia acanthamoebae (strain UV7) TaxID=765952 RepID=F8KZ38_PARAV|nr:hydrolase [Parachlamydia acanthamoebae]EFB41962.1 hypothetical protein pah_c022o300 [Parachlamydia acanthamoebae str. Hall's coccus]CCB86161.1 putative uncharacterized protein [Parachlamydia acanthamoebae UV-7]